MNLDELLQKYGNKVVDYKVFKKLTPEGKWALLQHWKAKFGNKNIREAWGLTPAAYYALSNRLKSVLKKDGINPDESYAMPESKRQRREMNVIEAEFSVQDEVKPTPPSFPAIEASAEASPAGQPVKEVNVAPMINFDITDDAANISERLTVIAALLKLEKGTLRVKIEVFQKIESPKGE